MALLLLLRAKVRQSQPRFHESLLCRHQVFLRSIRDTFGPFHHRIPHDYVPVTQKNQSSCQQLAYRMIDKINT